MTRKQRWATLAVVAGLAVLLLMPGVSQADTVIRGDMTMDRQAAEIPAGVTVQGDVHVSRADANIAGRVEGNVYIDRGNVTISGEVTGDVTVDRGTAKVAATGKVDGTLNLNRSSLEKAEGATIANTRSDAGSSTGTGVVATGDGVRVGDLSIGPDGIHGPGINIGPQGVHLPGVDIGPQGVQMPGFRAGPGGASFSGWHPGRWALLGAFDPVLRFFRWAALFALSLLVVAVWPHPVQSMSLLISEGPVRTLLAGLIAIGMLFLGTIALVITLIGIPLALFLWFAAAVAWFAGYVALSVFIGGKLGEVIPGLTPHNANGHSPFLPLLIGSLALALVGMVPVIGGLVGFAGFVMALGVVYQHQFGLGWPTFHRTAH